MTDAVVELHGHQKKIGMIVWHPLANNVLATAGFDKKVIIWDVERGEPAIVIEGHRDTIYSMCWSRDGSYLATTCKDKMMRIIDVRKEEIITVSFLAAMLDFVQSCFGVFWRRTTEENV